MERYVTLYSSVAFIPIGTVSSLLNLLVFGGESLRKNPCSIIFLALGTINLFYMNVVFVLRILNYGYGIDPTATNTIACRLVYYLSIVMANCESSYIILTSIDRILVTSRNANVRKRSTRRLALISILILTILWMAVHTHIWIFVDVMQLAPNFFVCFYRPGAYTVFFSVYSTAVSGVLSIVLMAAFGIWSIKNVRQLGRVGQISKTEAATGAVTVRQQNLQPKDQQLIRISLVQIITYIIFKCPVCLLLIYNQITQYQTKSAEQRSIEQSILRLSYAIFFTENCINGYLNICISKAFRSELKRLFLKFKCAGR